MRIAIMLLYAMNVDKFGLWDPRGNWQSMALFLVLLFICAIQDGKELYE